MRWMLLMMAIAANAFAAGPADGTDSLLLDDFSRTDGVSRLGTRWQFFTDGVMGGRSTGSANIAQWQGRRCLRLTGNVSLENNGGFIQARLPVAGRWSSLDASPFTGVRLLVRGNGERYAVHLRTSQTVLPWQYYQAEFTATPEWTEVRLPFTDFKPGGLRAGLDASRLKSVALVAIKREMKADVALARIDLY